MPHKTAQTWVTRTRQGLRGEDAAFLARSCITKGKPLRQLAEFWQACDAQVLLHAYMTQWVYNTSGTRECC